MEAPLDVVCVGAGWVTGNRHIPALLREPRCRILGVIDGHRDRAKAMAEQHRLAHWGTSIEEPWVAGAQCATIGTPPAQHAELATALLDRGLHVLCEKPMATTVADAEAMVAAAERNGRVLAVVHNFQFSSAMNRARSLIESGELGEITSVYAWQLSNPNRRLPHWYPTLPGGLFFDEAAHLLYLLRSILGEVRPTGVSAALDRSVSPVQVRQLNARMDHPSIWALLTMDFHSSVSEWQFVIVGTEQLIAVDIFRDVSVLLPNDRAHAARDILRTSWQGIREHLAGVARSGVGFLTKRLLYGNETVVGRFVEAARTGTQPAGISGRDGLAVVRDIHALLQHATM